MEYFGTNTRECGHYRWQFDKDGWLIKNWIKFDDLPFHPEELTNNLPKGEVVFYQSASFTVIAISGSCIDSRPGCKSVFWEKDIFTKEEMIERIMSYRGAVEIISSMPFKVKWN